jgi:hypothetical protein
MDQIKKILGWLKQQHFWVLSVLIVVIGFACWYTSASALDRQFKEHQGKIQGSFNTQQSIARETFHANPEILDKQQQELEKRQQDVGATWKELYERQRAGALKWPEELSQEFRDEVEKLKFGDNINDNLRNHYQNYADRHFSKLPAKIQAKELTGQAATVRGVRGDETWMPERPSPGRDGLTSEPIDEGYVCEWRDQQTVRAQLAFPETPMPLEIWVTQENLWAYHTLLDVIAATNQSVGADRPSNAAVRVIETLEVGQPAALESRTKDRIRLAESVANAATAVGAEGMDVSGRRPDVPDDSRTGQALTPEQQAMKLLSGRYVDGEGKPIPFTGGTDFRTAFGTEYKRLPVRLVLQMDLKSLSYLITQCANQPRQVEVQEVRINPRDTGGGFGQRRGGEQAFEGFAQLSAGTIEPFPLNPTYAKVVIQGVIYIFNEPNPGALQPAEIAAGAP